MIVEGIEIGTRIEGDRAITARKWRGTVRRWGVTRMPGETDAAIMARVNARADAWLADPHYKHPLTGERVQA